MPSLKEIIGKFRLLNTRLERSRAQQFVKRLDIKLEDIDQNLESLSGGNRQKIVLAKWLLAKPSALLLEEPTQAVDVGAAVEIRNIILELAQKNVGIIVATNDLEELVDICDRVLVMVKGNISKELIAPFSQEEILAACYSR